MDEMSWQAKLLKSNINITKIDYDHGLVYFDFAYRPYSGVPQKWGKTVAAIEVDELKSYNSAGELCKYIDWSKMANRIRSEVLELRKELEG